MIKLKSLMLRKPVDQYILDLVKADRVKYLASKRHCFNCHRRVEMVPEFITETLYLREYDKEVGVTEFPAEKCPNCGDITINGSVAAEVEELMIQARECPDTISFNNLLNGVVA